MKQELPRQMTQVIDQLIQNMTENSGRSSKQWMYDRFKQMQQLGYNLGVYQPIYEEIKQQLGGK